MSRITKAVAAAVRERSWKAVIEALQINQNYRAYDAAKAATVKGTEERLLKILGSLTLKKGEVLSHLTGAPSIKHNCNCGTATTEETVTISLMLKYPASKFTEFTTWLDKENKKLEELYAAYQQANQFSDRLSRNLTADWVYERYILDQRTMQKGWVWETAITEISLMFVKEFKASDKYVDPYKKQSIRKVLQG